MLKNERLCKHLCNTDTQTTSTVHWKLRQPFSPLLFQTQSPLLKKGSGSCTERNVASWSKFSSSVGLKIKSSSCWQGRCVCITAEPLYLPGQHCHCTCCSHRLVQFLGLVWTRDENTFSLSPCSSSPLQLCHVVPEHHTTASRDCHCQHLLPATGEKGSKSWWNAKKSIRSSLVSQES